MRQPFFINGYQIDEENMEALARWCKGHVVEDNGTRFIRVPVSGAKNEKQTRGYVGLWLTVSKLRGEPSFKVYNEEYLYKDFLEIPDDEAFQPATCCTPASTPPPSNMGAHFQPPALI